MIRILSALMMCLLLSCSDGGSTSVDLIAHAGGAVAGVPMTNSREAMINARDNGFKYIEFDLLFTSDSVLVAAHSWSEYNAAAGLSERGDSAPTSEEFFSRQLRDGFTPLGATEINNFFLSNDSLWLVTDKLSAPDLLDRHFPHLKSRMVVEAFSYDDYSELIKRGYGVVMYSCMADDIAAATSKHILFGWLFRGDKIERLALHTSAFEHPYLKFLMALFDFETSLFTINNPDEIPERAMDGLRFIYTDSLLPKDFYLNSNR